MDLRVRVTDAPLLLDSVVSIGVPELLDEFKNAFWGSNLFVTERSIVLHTLRLSKRHVYTVLFRFYTTLSLLSKVSNARVYKVFVKGLSISKRLNGHSLVLFGRRNTGIDIVR